MATPDSNQLRQTPHDIEAEKATLGALILDSSRFIEAREYVDAMDFYKSGHQIIFRAIESLVDEDKGVDATTIASILMTNGELEAVGGAAYIMELMERTPTTANLIYYAQIVQEKSALRNYIKTLQDGIDKAYGQEEPSEDLLADTEKQLTEIAQGNNKNGFQSVADILNDTYAAIQERAMNGGAVTGLSTGFKDFDKLTTGLHGEQLMILAARPGVGKTALALNIARNVALHENKSVAIFSLEMGADSLVERLLIAQGMIDSYHLRTGDLTDDDWVKLTLAINALSKAQMYVDDTAMIKINEIRSRARKLAKETGNLGLIVIDYLQLITGNGKENRQQEISDVSRQLKILAKELNVPVIALSQLSRSIEQRQDKRPMLSDIRESGSIEQDADIVSFIDRDYYGREGDEEGEEPAPREDTDIEGAVWIIAKNRAGSQGDVNLMFHKNNSLFVTIDKQHDEPF